jgi:hypothetical protein
VSSRKRHTSKLQLGVERRHLDRARLLFTLTPPLGVADDVRDEHVAFVGDTLTRCERSDQRHAHDAQLDGIDVH